MLGLRKGTPQKYVFQCRRLKTKGIGRGRDREFAGLIKELRQITLDASITEDSTAAPIKLCKGPTLAMFSQPSSNETSTQVHLK